MQKKAWRATNHRDKHPQMVKWPECQEKVAMYNTLQARLSDEAANVAASIAGIPAADATRETGVLLAKYPSVNQQSL